MRQEHGFRTAGMLAAIIVIVGSALAGPCLAEDAPADRPAAEPTNAAPSQAQPTKEEIVKQLGEITKKLKGLQESVEAEAKRRPAAAAARRMLTEEEAELDRVRKQFEDLESIDTETLLAPVERTAEPAESGVDRLQRHQRELTTQKLGEQIIILDQNP